MGASACQPQGWALQPCSATSASSALHGMFWTAAVATEERHQTEMVPLDGQLPGNVASTAKRDMRSEPLVAPFPRCYQVLSTRASVSSTQPAADSGPAHQRSMDLLGSSTAHAPPRDKSCLDTTMPMRHPMCSTFVSCQCVMPPSAAAGHDSMVHCASVTCHLRSWVAPLWAMSPELYEVRTAETRLDSVNPRCHHQQLMAFLLLKGRHDIIRSVFSC